MGQLQWLDTRATARAYGNETHASSFFHAYTRSLSIHFSRPLRLSFFLCSLLVDSEARTLPSGGMPKKEMRAGSREGMTAAESKVAASVVNTIRCC